MAFWSAELTQKEKLDTNEELEEGYVIQLSGASLTPAAKQGDKVFLYIQSEEDEPKIVAAVLVAGTSDYVSLNLMLPAGQGLVLSTSGANTPVHLTGSIQEDPSLYGNPDLFDNEDEDDENEDEDDDENDDDDEELDEEEEEAKLKLLRAKPAGSKIKEINDKEAKKPAKGGKPSNDKHEEHSKAEEKVKAAETPKVAKHEEHSKAEEKAKAAETPKDANGNKRPASDGTEEKSDKKPKTAPNTPASSGDLKCSCGKPFKVAGALDAHKKATAHK